MNDEDENEHGMDQDQDMDMDMDIRASATVMADGSCPLFSSQYSDEKGTSALRCDITM